MFSGSHTAFVFPAFASDYTDHPAQSLDFFHDLFTGLLNEAARERFQDLLPFDFVTRNHLGDERKTQLITYIYSCAVSQALQRLGARAEGVAGYSMGIYAACFHAGVFGFADGLTLIDAAYRAISRHTGGQEYGMGTVIGLTLEDLQTLLEGAGDAAGITNRNGPHAFVISGRRSAVEEILERAREEGALHVRQLLVNTPYHAAFLAPAATLFEAAAAAIPMRPPTARIYSVIDGTSLADADSIRRELVRNLYQPLDWYAAMQRMMTDGIDLFIESGPSRGLAKNARFTGGEFRFLSLDRLPPSNRGSVAAPSGSEAGS